MRSNRDSFVLALVSAAIVGLAMPANVAAELSEPRVGPYLTGGVNVGEPDFDGRGLDGKTGGGLLVGGGYFFTPWLAGQIDGTFLGGADVKARGNHIGDANYWAVTATAKGYPMAAIDPTDYPAWLQPYGLFGMGGGVIDIDGDGGDGSTEGTFVARFGMGVDFLVHENFGPYVEGGYHVTSEDDLDGVGIFTLGAFYRF